MSRTQVSSDSVVVWLLTGVYLKMEGKGVKSWATKKFQIFEKTFLNSRGGYFLEGWVGGKTNWTHGTSHSV